MRLHVLAVISILMFSAHPGLAEVGDAAAVIRYCGAPTGEHQGVSPVTNRMERDLTYGGLILHFQPAADGWTFLSGWDNHLPMTQKMLENRIPCFHEAMMQSAAQQPHGPAANEDPAIREQSAVPAADTSTFGIPHLWLLLLLVGLVVVIFLLPGARRRRARLTPDVEKMRYRRKPRVVAEKMRPGTGPRRDV